MYISRCTHNRHSAHCQHDDMWSTLGAWLAAGFRQHYGQTEQKAASHQAQEGSSRHPAAVMPKPELQASNLDWSSFIIIIIRCFFVCRCGFQASACTLGVKVPLGCAVLICSSTRA
jgi:hypothetical protein